MICWKIRIFAYWTTPEAQGQRQGAQLWFAEKFVSLLIEQHRSLGRGSDKASCDLLKNSYLCLLNNTWLCNVVTLIAVVICWKIRIFAYWTTPSYIIRLRLLCCDLLKNSYLCLLNNTWGFLLKSIENVVICWKIRIFAYWTTPLEPPVSSNTCCDLLKNSYLCLLNNTSPPHV